MVPRVPANPAPLPESNPGQKIGFVLLLAFLYFFNSRLLDVSKIYYLHIPLVLGVITGVCALFSGCLFRGFRTPVGLCCLALTVWFMAGLPSSFWRGGSFIQLQNWLRTLAIWAFLVGLTVTYKECKLVLNTLVLAAATAAVFGLTTQDTVSAGRLGLEVGRLSNPNYFALSLIITLPFAWRWYWNGGQPGMVRRVVAAACGAVICVGFLRSGPRTGLYTVAVMVVMVFLRARTSQKIPILVATAVAFALGFGLLPSYLRERYLTLSSVEGSYDSRFAAQLAVSAAGSTLERQYLFRRSLAVTMSHPVFGVGMGNFAPYVSETNQEEGIAKQAWLGTHNTYTQLSSEAGIPALLLYLEILGLSWRLLSRLIRATRGDPRPEAKDVRGTAIAAQACLVAFCFSLFFIHVGYDILGYLLPGIVLIVYSTGQRYLQLAPAHAPAQTILPARDVRLVQSAVAFGARART